MSCRKILCPGTRTVSLEFLAQDRRQWLARALTVRGSESTFKMILAHKIPGDFASAVADVPRRSNGKPVSMKPVAQQASELARALMATTERLAAEAASRQVKGVSESASER